MTYTFGGKLKKLRNEKGLSQKELAKQSGVPFYTIVSLELNRSKVPLITTVIKFTKYFKVDISKFIDDIIF